MDWSLEDVDDDEEAVTTTATVMVVRKKDVGVKGDDGLEARSL